jgi:hypothetical protein
MQEYRVTVGEYTTGTIRFYKPGTDLLHRLDGPAVEYLSGTKRWYQNNQLHRLDGPAIEWIDGDKFWYVNGKRHRLDGPAVELAIGTVEYWIEGNKLTEAQFKEKTAPVKEMTVAEIEAALGHSVKVVK